MSEISTVNKKYLEYRENVLRYTYHDMNLKLENDMQVYIALFDIPIESDIYGMQTQSLALIFGLNTHVYNGNGDALVKLEQNPEVMQKMQSLLISSSQVLNTMSLTNNIDFYESEHVRAYLKTRKGIYYKELKEDIRHDRFLLDLMRQVLLTIEQHV